MPIFDSPVATFDSPLFFWDEGASFIPPTVNEVPPVLPVGDDVANRLFRFFRSRPAGVTVYLYKVGTLSEAAHGRVTEDDPITLYDSAGNPTTNGWDDLEQVFWGGTNAYELRSDWATVLQAAGYSLL